MRRTLWFPVVLLLVGLTGCMGSRPDGDQSSPAPLASPDPDAIDAAELASGQSIRITDEGILPPWLIAVVDEDVTWVNETDASLRIRLVAGKEMLGAVEPGGVLTYRPESTVSLAYDVLGGTETLRGAIQVEPEYMPGETPYEDFTP